jgi:[ribosomal protein S18]-alanine N-acetyltransferase
MTEPAFSLRPAQPGDLPGLMALEQSSFSGDRLSARQFRYHLGHRRNRLLVAKIDDKVAGAALVFLRRGSDLARLYSIAVDARARGRGLGAALLQAAEQAARAAGARRLRLEVRHDNAAAIGLYRKLGYEVFARQSGYYEDGCEAVRMEKRLLRPAQDKPATR